MHISTSAKRKLAALAGFLAFGLCLYLFSFGWIFIFQPDSAWLFKTGEWIVSHGALPPHDLFSWTLPDKHWVLYQWLYETIMGTVLKVGSLWSAGLFQYILAGILLLCVLPSMWLRRGVPIWITFGMTSLALTEVWFQARPQICSYFLILAFVAILERYRKGGSPNHLWWLAPLMVLWANLHSFWFIGLLAILCYAITVKDKHHHLWMVLLVCTACVLINPYGFQLVTYNLSFINEITQEINELLPPLVIANNETFLFFAYIIVTWIILCARVRRVPAAGLLFSLIATVAALRYARFMPIAVLATWPYAGLSLAPLPSVSQKNPVTKFGALVVAVLLALAIALPSYIWSRAIPDLAAANAMLSGGQYEAINFIASHKVPAERLYNDEALGSRLLFFGASKVFIDNRFDFYGNKFHREWMPAHDATMGWKELLQRYQVNAIALSSGKILEDRLFSDPDWVLVYDDGTLTYWVANTTQNNELIGIWSMTPEQIGQAPISDWARRKTLDSLYKKYLATGLALMNAQQLDAAEQYFRAGLKIAPRSPDYRHWLIHTLAVAGKSAELAQELRVARPFFWRFEGESIGPADPNARLDALQQARVDAWVADSTKQLIDKYAKK